MRLVETCVAIASFHNPSAKTITLSFILTAQSFIEMILHMHLFLADALSQCSD